MNKKSTPKLTVPINGIKQLSTIGKPWEDYDSIQSMVKSTETLKREFEKYDSVNQP